MTSPTALPQAPPTGVLADHYFMLHALVLASRGQYTTHPNPNVGCVLVAAGRLPAWVQRPLGDTSTGSHSAGGAALQLSAALEALAATLPARLLADLTPLPDVPTLLRQACLRLWEQGATVHAGLEALTAVCTPLDEAIVGTGFHARAGGPHAEVRALREAGPEAPGATAYVSLEPCAHHGRTPPCADALVAAQVKRVVVAMTDPFSQVAGQGLVRLEEAEIAVTTGVMTAAARALNPGFLQQVEQQRPYVRLKLAASLDGRTALANGVSQWITGATARGEVQAGRARAGAILSGAGTVLADNPRLNVRPEQLPAGAARAELAAATVRQPVRVIIDHRGEVTPEHRVLQDEVPVYLVRTRALGQSLPAWVTEWVVPPAADRPGGPVDLTALLTRLGEAGINEIWVEAGPRLGGALVRAALVDQLLVYQAPCLLGHQSRPLLELPQWTTLEEVPDWTLLDVRQVGADVRHTLVPAAVSQECQKESDDV